MMIFTAIKYLIWNKMLRRPTEYDKWLDRKGWEESFKNTFHK